MNRFRLLVASVVIALVGVAGCSDDTTVVEPAPTGAVTINFDNYVGSGGGRTAVVIDGLNLQYTNPYGTSYSVSRLRYVVSNVMLHMTNGRTFGTDNIHYRNQADATTRAFSLGGVPAGTYDKVTFTFGLDGSKNIRNFFNGTSEQQFHDDMFWPTPMGPPVGYHYMMIEGNFDNGSVAGGYATHTGARQLDGSNPMMPGVVDNTPYHHFFRIDVPITATKIDGDAWTITVDVDVNAWFADIDTSDSYDSSVDWPLLANQAIMANLDIQARLMTNGPACFEATIVKQ